MAYAEGKIELPPMDKDASNNQLRYAPSFAMNNSGFGPDRTGRYTEQQVAELLGLDLIFQPLV